MLHKVSDAVPPMGVSPSTLLRIVKWTGVFSHPTLKRVDSIIVAEIMVQRII